MGGINAAFRHFLDDVHLNEEALPNQPVVELLGDGRVLVENHLGVTQYCTQKIQVQLNYGAVRVTGSNLRLRFMSGHKLVIVGRIEGLDIIRRGEK